MPESPSRLRARYHALLASGLRPVTALAVSIAVIIGRAIPTLAVVAICGALIDGLGARTVGVVIAGGTLVLLCIGLLTLVIVCPVSDATQFWLRWNAANSSPCRTRRWSFHRTVWAGIRGTNRLYQRRLGYRQLDL
jgi:hypothetical protein